jgi:hypothetical protein
MNVDGQNTVMAKPRSEIISDYAKRRKAAGMRKVSVWLDGNSINALDRLAKKYGSKTEAIEMAIWKALGIDPPDADREPDE